MKTLSVVAVEYGGNFTGSTLYIPREFLKALLSALDQKKNGKEADCMVAIRRAHAEKTPKTIEVLALENEEYYSGRRFPGDVYHTDNPD